MLSFYFRLIGGAGVVTGQSIGSDYVIFEPGSRHSFQEAMGRSIANPTAMILCAANMLNHLHLNEYGNALRNSVETVIREGKVRTRDMGGLVSWL
uniref:Iso_dh domain-containing protein n=1 Tax=Heterorhabditis bacteriophora TaxID=37862 RepID=A0A1I7WPK9_HETBA